MVIKTTYAVEIVAWAALFQTFTPILWAIPGFAKSWQGSLQRGGSDTGLPRTRPGLAMTDAESHRLPQSDSAKLGCASPLSPDEHKRLDESESWPWGIGGIEAILTVNGAAYSTNNVTPGLTSHQVAIGGMPLPATSATQCPGTAARTVEGEGPSSTIRPSRPDPDPGGSKHRVDRARSGQIQTEPS
ncbi:hypothetical protein EJ110_NYTH44254 [Nymphaea thermarum]|nr:hypothetical protein EJ110_NYTH44254 [Nymphaea thermarum]